MCGYYVKLCSGVFLCVDIMNFVSVNFYFQSSFYKKLVGYVYSEKYIKRFITAPLFSNNTIFRIFLVFSIFFRRCYQYINSYAKSYSYAKSKFCKSNLRATDFSTLHSYSILFSIKKLSNNWRNV